MLQINHESKGSALSTTGVGTTLVTLKPKNLENVTGPSNRIISELTSVLKYVFKNI